MLDERFGVDCIHDLDRKSDSALLDDLDDHGPHFHGLPRLP